MSLLDIRLHKSSSSPNSNEAKNPFLEKMTFLQEILNHRMRVLKSLAVYLAFIGVGLCNGIVGPTILVLQIAANTTLSEIAMVLPGRSGGYALGSFTVGLLYSFLNPQLDILLSLATGSVFMALVPWMRSLWTIVMMLFANGLMNGMIDAAGNMFVLHIRGKENPPFMQALHFAWGVGSFVAPLFAKPFLLPLEPIDELTLASNAASLNVTLNSTQGYTADDLIIQWPFSFTSFYSAWVALIFLFLYIKHRQTPPHPTREAALTAEASSTDASRSTMKIICVILTALFLHLHCGLVIAYGTLLTPYAVHCSLKLSKATGALMSAMFWGFFTFFRMSTVFYISWTGAEKNIIYELIATVVGCAILVPFGSTHVEALWAGVALMGIGTSSIWASTYGFLEQFFPVNSRMAATFTFAACLGEFILPTIMGNYLEAHPDIFLWATLICTVADCGIFALLSYVCHKHFGKPLSVLVDNTNNNDNELTISGSLALRTASDTKTLDDKYNDVTISNGYPDIIRQV